jgi:peptide/nickel transport system permease protein
VESMMVRQEADTLRAEAPTGEVARSTGWQQTLALLSHDKAALFSLLFLVILGLAALLAPVLFDESALKMDLSLRFVPPGLGTGHIFGTDQLGRDMVGRILMASRVSLTTAFIVVALSMAFGLVLGVIAGYYGGWFDDAIMRFVDVAMGFPSLLLALVVIYALGPSIVNVVLVLAATRWILYTRVSRAETLKIRRFSYVEAGQLIGGSDPWILRKHVFPNLVCVLFTLATLELATVILAESALSFLGLGVQPPDASLGLLIAQGKEYITTAWWVMFFPGVAIFATTMALSLLANWLGIALDPVQRWRLTSGRRG